MKALGFIPAGAIGRATGSSSQKHAEQGSSIKCVRSVRVAYKYSRSVEGRERRVSDGICPGAAGTGFRNL
jgi:hypothetical protein